MSVRRSLAWAFSGQFTAAFVLFLAWLVIARLLTPAEVGIFAVAYASAGVVNVLAAVGTNAYIVREIELEPAKVDTAFTVNAILYVVLAAIIFLLSFPVARFLAEPGVGSVLRLLALRPLFMALEFRPSALLQREMRFKPISLITGAAAAANATCMVTLALLGHSYMSLAWGMVTGSVVSAAAYNILAANHASLRVSLAHWRAVTAFGLRMLTISGLALLVQRISEVIMGRLLGLASLGLFTRATQISDMIFYNLFGTATRVAFVQLSRDNRERGSISATFLRSMELFTALMWPLLLGLAVLAKPAIFILYGERWLDAAIPLSLLMIAQVIAVGFGMNWELFVLKDETARQTRIEAVRAGFGLTAFTIGCTIGLTAAAIGRIVDCLVGFLLYHSHMKRLAGVSTSQIWRAFGASALLAAGAILPPLGLMLWTHWSERTPPLALAIAVAAGIGIWLALATAIRHPLVAELKRFAGMLGGRTLPVEPGP